MKRKKDILRNILNKSLITGTLILASGLLSFWDDYTTQNYHLFLISMPMLGVGVFLIARELVKPTKTLKQVPVEQEKSVSPMQSLFRIGNGVIILASGVVLCWLTYRTMDNYWLLLIPLTLGIITVGFRIFAEGVKAYLTKRRYSSGNE